jgi:HDOD domain
MNNQLFGFMTYNHKGGILYALVAKEQTRLMEIGCHIFRNLPEKLQNTMYMHLNKGLPNSIALLLIDTAHISTQHKKLVEYIDKTEIQKSSIISSPFVNDILSKIPKLPSYTNDILAKLANDDVSTQEIVSLIQSDPSLVGIILKTVNSSY